MDIDVMKAEGGGQTRSNYNGIPGVQPEQWSLDGAKFAFQNGQDGKNEISVMNVDGSV